MSKKPWETDSCEAVQAYFTVYPVPVAAALWCGIPPEDVEESLSISTQSSRGVYKHPYIRCLEPRCRAIHDAIEKGLLPCSRENGKVVEEHVANERRHVSRQHLKDWIAAQFPSDKPAFLFDEIERNTHAAISADSFRALQADRDALKARVEKAAEEYRKLRSERDALVAERDALAEQIKNPQDPGPRAQTTYLNIIGAMVAVVLGKSPAGKPNSVFNSQSAVIDQVLAHYDGKPGISRRSLEEKFAEGKKSLGQ
jgi:FtsZ-binding cell division protein ZapB